LIERKGERMSAKKNETSESPVDGGVAEPVAKEAFPEPAGAPAPVVKTIVRKRNELVAVTDATASGVSISVAVEVGDCPMISELHVKGARADAKAKAVLKKVAALIPRSTALSPKPARFDLLEKKVIIEVRAEPLLDNETQESVRRTMK